MAAAAAADGDDASTTASEVLSVTRSEALSAKLDNPSVSSWTEAASETSEGGRTCCSAWAGIVGLIESKARKTRHRISTAGALSSIAAANTTRGLTDKSLFAMAAACGAAAVMWSVVCAALIGSLPLVLIPLAYPAGLAAAILLSRNFVQHRRDIIATSHEVLLLFLPVCVSWAFGGIAASGNVILWASVSPVSAILIHKDTKRALVLFLAFISLTAFTALCEVFDIAVAYDPNRVKLPWKHIPNVLSFFTDVGVTFVTLVAVGIKSQGERRLLEASRNLVKSMMPNRVAEELLESSLFVIDQVKKAPKVAPLTRQGSKAEIKRIVMEAGGIEELRAQQMQILATDRGVEALMQRSVTGRSSFSSERPVGASFNDSSDSSDDYAPLNGVRPRVHVCATVLFMDLVGFSKETQSMSPAVLLRTMDEIFIRIDRIAHKFAVTKVRTIGDGYLAAVGLGEAFGDERDIKKQASRAIMFALAVLRLIKKERWGPTGAQVKVRVGVHSGGIYSGVVGLMQPQYDLFGAAVNLAARFEQNAEPGTVLCSDTTRQMALIEAPGKLSFTSVGMLAMKNMGTVEGFRASFASEAAAVDASSEGAPVAAPADAAGPSDASSPSVGASLV